MLQHLRVQNFGILEDATIEPSPGFTVITGETGAGKTLLLGGLRLLLGGKAASSMVGPSSEQVQIDGLFAESDQETGVTRVVPKEGRSRAHLDGAIVSAVTLEENLGVFVEVVGQHDQLTLKRASNVMALVDSTLDAGGASVRISYDESWKALRSVLARERAIGSDQTTLHRELDLLRYQSAELSKAGLEPGDDVRLEAEAAGLRNVEEVREQLAESIRILQNVHDETGEAVARIRKASELDTSMLPFEESVEGVVAEVGELARRLRDRADSLENDPERLDILEQQLTVIGDMKRKYGPTLSDVVDFADGISQRVLELEKLLSDAGEIEAVVVEAQARVSLDAENLSKIRRSRASSLVGDIERHLADMGLQQATVDFVFESVVCGPSGSDRVELFFSSDKGLDLAPVKSVASGGELSRLVLAVRLATQSSGTRTLIFDEIDSGVGGATALAVGRKLAELSKQAQVLCVTHLPQVAAHADTQYVVHRDGASAIVKRVEAGDRISEISRMLAGFSDSAAGDGAAEELLQSALS